MKFFKSIFLFFKNLFTGSEKVQLIAAAPIEQTSCNDTQKKNKFVNSLKVQIPKHINPKIETQICIGDGLGIQSKLTY